MDCISVVLSITLITLIRFWLRGKKPRNFPPGFDGVPVLGVLPFISDNQAADFMKWGKKFGSVFYVRIGPADIVVLNDYDAIHECVVKNGKSASGRNESRLFNDVRKNQGLVFKDFDENLKTNRKYFMSSLKRFGGMSARLDELVCDEMKYLSNEILKHNGQAFNIKGPIFHSVCALISHIAFGKRLDYEDETISTLVKGLTDLFVNKDSGNLLFLLVLEHRLKYFPKFSNAYKTFQKLYNRRSEIFREMIKDHRLTWDKDETRDAIDLFISQYENSSSEAITEDEFVYVLTDLFDGGSETTTTALHWCILYLATDPITQKKLFAEINDVIEGNMPKYNDKTSMPLMSSFLDEILRHRTLAPIGAMHKSQNSFKLKEYVIPKNTQILTNIWSVHHDQNTYDEPEKFIPDRFIDKETGKYSKPSNFLPFGLGPRKCPGFDFAERALFLILTSLLQSFEIKEDIDHPLPDYNVGTLGIVYFPRDFQVICSQREKE